MGGSCTSWQLCNLSVFFRCVTVFCLRCMNIFFQHLNISYYKMHFHTRTGRFHDTEGWTVIRSVLGPSASAVPVPRPVQHDVQHEVETIQGDQGKTYNIFLVVRRFNSGSIFILQFLFNAFWNPVAYILEVMYVTAPIEWFSLINLFLSLIFKSCYQELESIH